MIFSRPHSEDKARFEAAIDQRARELQKNFYSRFTTFQDKDILELGAGPYALRTYVQSSPRSYLLANVTFGPAFDDFDHPVVRRLVTTDAMLPLENDSVDIVISENCFEHLRAYESMIAELKRVLRPGGFLLTQFSPLYFSPYGAHFHDITMVPWIHLINNDRRLKEIIARKAGSTENFEYNWDQYKTLNRLVASEFLQPLKGDGWQLMRATTFPFPTSLYWPEPLSRLLTHGLRIAARKR